RHHVEGVVRVVAGEVGGEAEQGEDGERLVRGEELRPRGGGEREGQKDGEDAHGRGPVEGRTAPEKEVCRPPPARVAPAFPPQRYPIGYPPAPRRTRTA